mmetsp:Transcript_11133/g.20682  ORF Transcript_11133/g.20682 Transcript_11133/m.20682 type:complete len:352 (-) Transcript_11133:2474-3529(-)
MGNEVSSPLEKAAFDIIPEKKPDIKLQKLFAARNTTAQEKAALFRARDSLGRTLLMVACVHNKVKCVQYLIDQGAPVGVTSSSGMTPLHFVCASKKEDKAIELISILLNVNADPLTRDEKFRLPVHVAQIAGRVPVIRHLESRVCDYVGTLKVESVSSMQYGIGAMFGDNAREQLVTKFGSNWKTKWIVICRAQGSRLMAKTPAFRCPKCLTEQDGATGDATHVNCRCGQVLIVPEKQSVLMNTLQVYESCNSSLPETIYDLKNCQVEMGTTNGNSVITITLDEEFLQYTDPVYVGRQAITDNFRKARKRFAIRQPNVIRIGSADVSAVRVAYTALTRNIRQLPEPGKKDT